MSGGADTGGADTGGASPTTDGGGSSGPAQVIPKMRGEVDDGDDGGPANDNGTPRTRTPKPTKHKIKYFGQEREVSSLDEVLPLLSDDYEHEITVSGQARKAKYPDLVRGYQLSEGAFDRMRKAAEIEKSWGEKLKHGSEDPIWGMQNLLGVQDPTMFAAQLIKQRMAEDEQIRKAYEEGDHLTHQRLVNERAKRELEQQKAFELAKQQREEQAQKQAAAQQARAKSIHDAVKAAGLPWTRSLAAHATAIDAKWRSLGHELPADHVAAEAGKEWFAEVNGHLDSLDEEGLVKFLGDQRRKKLREYELAAVRKSAKQAQQQPAQTQNGNGAAKRNDTPKGMTEREYLNRMRGGG